MCFWSSLAFSVSQHKLTIWSLVPLPFLSPAGTSGSSWFMYCWSMAWGILSITLLACKMSSTVPWFEHFYHCLSLGLEWKLTFFSPVASAEFSKFAGILSAALPQHHLLGFKIAALESTISTSFVYGDVSLRPTRLHNPGSLAQGEWSHHRDYLG